MKEADYSKQREDIFRKLNNKEILVNDIVDMLIDARIQRDESMKMLKKSRRRNYNLVQKQRKAAKQLQRVREGLLN